MWNLCLGLGSVTARVCDLGHVTSHFWAWIASKAGELGLCHYNFRSNFKFKKKIFLCRYDDGVPNVNCHMFTRKFYLNQRTSHWWWHLGISKGDDLGQRWLFHMSPTSLGKKIPSLASGFYLFLSLQPLAPALKTSGCLWTSEAMLAVGRGRLFCCNPAWWSSAASFPP